MPASLSVSSQHFYQLFSEYWRLFMASKKKSMRGKTRIWHRTPKIAMQLFTSIKRMTELQLQPMLMTLYLVMMKKSLKWKGSFAQIAWLFTRIQPWPWQASIPCWWRKQREWEVIWPLLIQTNKTVCLLTKTILIGRKNSIQLALCSDAFGSLSATQL